MLSGVDANVHDPSTLSAGNTQGVVANVTGFLTKDGSEKLLFRRLVGLTFGSDFADQNVAALYEGSDADDSHLIKVAKAFFSNIGKFPGDLFGTKLGLTGFNLVLLDMH